MHSMMRQHEAERGPVTLPDRDLLTVEQVADYLQMHPETIRKGLRAGELPGVNFGGVAGWRIRREDLVAFIDKRRDRGQK